MGQLVLPLAGDLRVRRQKQHQAQHIPRLPEPVMAMMASRSVTAAVKPLLRLSTSQNCAAKSSSPPIREYFLKMTSPSRVV